MVSTLLNGYGFAPIQAGNLTARLAGVPEDIDAAQALRFRVFYEEMGAVPSTETLARKRDFDRFDSICDHLLVVDENRVDKAAGVVGTYPFNRVLTI